MGELKDCYGLLLPEGKKFSRKPDAGNYSMEGTVFKDHMKQGDTLGLLLEFPDPEKATLTFFRNGKLIGKIFNEIKPMNYFPCASLLQLNNEITLVPSARMPMEPFKKDGEQEEEKKVLPQLFGDDDY